jgi:hypothetical protein
MLAILVFIILAIGIVFLKDGEIHKKLYLSTFEHSSFISSGATLNTTEYDNIKEFITVYRGGGVLFSDNYGESYAKQLQEEGYKVLYCKVPKNVNYFEWFDSQFNNIFWWSKKKPEHFLHNSDLIVILDDYDNLMDAYPDDRDGITISIAVIQSSNMMLFKPIFILKSKSYANEILQYNSHTKFQNLYSKSFRQFID